jgi:uncharacterized protein (TIGR02246 family)
MRRHGLATILALALSVLGGAAGGGAAAQEDRPQDRAALRALRDAAAAAINARDFAAVAGVVHPDLTVVTVDQQRFQGLPAFQAYWQGLFQGPRAPLRSITLRPDTEDTRFLGEDLALSHGTSTDAYAFTDGDTRTMKVRWSAVTRRVDGQWRLLSVHIGTDLFDNPVLQAAAGRARRVAAGAAALGLVAGAAVGFLVGRRRAPRAA